MTRGPGSLLHNKSNLLALFWLANKIRPHPFP